MQGESAIPRWEVRSTYYGGGTSRFSSCQRTRESTACSWQEKHIDSVQQVWKAQYVQHALVR